MFFYEITEMKGFFFQFLHLYSNAAEMAINSYTGKKANKRFQAFCG